MAAKRTGAASGNRKTATRKRNTQSAGRKTSSRAAQNRAKTAKNPRTFSKEEELRGIQLRRDIRLILLLFGMGFLFIAELGMAGPVGRVFSDIAFGLFGLPAYVLPFFLFFLVLFIVSNKDNASVWFKTAACIVLFLCAGIICELQSGRMKTEAFSLQEAYLLSIQEHSGGGILSGGITWMLYHALKMGGTILVLTALIIICVIILTQRSFTMLLRDLRDSRNAQEGPGILERGRNALTEHRDRARERREYRRELEEEERERRREERLQRRREMEAAREEEILGIRRGPDPVDLDDLTIGAPADEAEDTYDYGARRPSGDRSPYAYDAEPDDGPADDCEEPGYTDEYTAYEVGEEDPYGGYPGDEETSIHSYRLGTDELHEITSSAPRGSADGPVRRVSITVQPKAPSTGRVIKKFGAAGGVLGGREYTEETAAPSMSPVELPPEEELPEFFPEEELPEEELAMTEPEVEEEIPFDEEEMPAAPAAAPAHAASPSVSPAAAPVAEKTAAAPAGSAADARPRTTGEDLNGVPVYRDRGESGPGKTGTVRKAAPSKGRKYVFPSTDLLPRTEGGRSAETDRQLRDTAAELKETLATFGIDVTITDISQGPSVTRFELQPEQGIKVKKIVSLADDIQLRLAKEFLRIEAPIPGKAAIGIEVSNSEKTMVGLREMLESREFRSFDGNLAFAVGKDITGKNVIADIARMPHVLIAGATGSGKSVCINTIIMSLLYKYTPDEVKMIMIDPKVVELSVYNGIPHLMIPVVTDPRKASAALNWAVAEMSNRYDKFAKLQVRNLKGYNAAVREMIRRGEETEYTIMPRLVVIVDELADLMMVARQDVEKAICRLAQLARAAGIHLIIATQRPSVDVITGLIKANMPSRIAFAVTSQVDSRTILDIVGAEKLMGKGDMLYHPQDAQKPMRIQGAYVDEDVIPDVVNFIKEHNSPDHDAEEISEAIDRIAEQGIGAAGGGADVSGQSAHDEYFVQCGRFVTEKKNATIGRLQRLCSIGFNRAARIMDELADAGVVSAADGTKGRQVLMTQEEFENYIQNEM